MADQTFNFDDGTAQGWTLSSETGATASVAAAAALNGSSYGLSFVWSSQNSNECYAEETLTSAYSDLYVRFRFKIISGSAGQYGGTYCMFFVPGESSVFNAMSRVNLYWDGATWSLRDLLTSTDIDLATDTEYDIEIRSLRDATAGGFQIWVDGTLELDALAYDTSGSDLQYLSIGSYNTNGNMASGSGFYIDEIEVAGSRIGGGGTDALTGADLTSGTPTLDTPTIGQTHALTGSELTSSAPTLDTPTVGQTHALTGADLTGSAPTLDTPTVGQVHHFDSADILGGVSLGAPSLGQVHVMTSSDLVGNSPLLGAPFVNYTGPVVSNAQRSVASRVAEALLLQKE